jgi:hypothetical protein
MNTGHTGVFRRVRRAPPGAIIWLGKVDKGGKIMAPSSLVRVGGALASIVAGAFVALGQLINLGGTQEYGTVFGQNLVLISHVAFVFAFVGLYAAQAERSGILGQLGMVLGTIGTTLGRV